MTEPTKKAFSITDMRQLTIDELRKIAADLGIDVSNFSYAQLIQVVIAGMLSVLGGLAVQQKKTMACGPDQCDHKACALATLESALNTADIAAQHCHQCCCEEPC